MTYGYKLSHNNVPAVNQLLTTQIPGFSVRKTSTGGLRVTSSGAQRRTS